MSPLTLSQCLAIPFVRATAWSDPITRAMDQYEINTPVRQAMFVAQIGHESGGLRYVRELWGPTPAQQRYEGRVDLGNTQPGDGFRYCGRGLIQITGRVNYEAVDRGLGIGCVANPRLLEVPVYAARSAAWWWQAKGLNEMADANTDEAFVRVTRRINGGTNGLDDRRELWGLSKKHLGVK